MPNLTQMPRGNILSTFMQFRQNPLALLSKRFQIPDGINDPNQIIQHLVDTKQVSQDQINLIRQFNTH